MTPFASFAEAGRLLAPVVVPAVTTAAPVLVGLNDRGQLVAAPVAAALGVPMSPVRVAAVAGERTVVGLPDVVGREVVVVDDGVETGSAARMTVGLLRALGAMRILLAVPVCNAAQVPALTQAYDALVHLATCDEDATLSGHYASFDTLS